METGRLNRPKDGRFTAQVSTSDDPSEGTGASTHPRRGALDCLILRGLASQTRWVHARAGGRFARASVAARATDAPPWGATPGTNTVVTSDGASAPAWAPEDACKHHPSRAASGICVRCRARFCPECMTKLDGINYCVQCLAALDGAERQRRGEAVAVAESRSSVTSAALFLAGFLALTLGAWLLLELGALW